MELRPKFHYGPKTEIALGEGNKRGEGVRRFQEDGEAEVGTSRGNHENFGLPARQRRATSA
jgi:hypothetical protein